MSKGDTPPPGDLSAFGEGADMSDAELDAMMAGALPGAAEEDAVVVEPGERVRGIVIGVSDGEVLLEFDQKTHGVIDASEFPQDELPVVGSALEALVQRYDRQREVVVLSVNETLKEIFWDDLTAGSVFEGSVTDVNKGGLTVDIKGTRAFLPISQIERYRVDDASVYVGRTLTVEVISFDRENQDLVVSRRNILDREAEVVRQETIGTFSEGQVVRGTVTRVNEHGAFIDLGGVDGLLHASKIRKQLDSSGAQGTIEPGQSIEVEIAYMDPERGRIGLDLHHSAAGECRKLRLVAAEYSGV